MEDKNLASEMLNQMKKYVGSDTSDAKDAASSDVVDSVDRYSPREPEAQRSQKVRALPSDDSLFEFDGFVEEPAVPEPSSLTVEEAEYVEELREKFGISKNVGVAFISDDDLENEDEKAFEAPVAEPVVEEVVEAPVAEPAVEEAVEVPVAETVVEEEPEQVTFAGTDADPIKPVIEIRPIPERTPEGVQITFLDAPEEPIDEFEGAEQIEFDTKQNDEIETEEAPVDESASMEYVAEAVDVQEEPVIELAAADEQITEEEMAAEAEPTYTEEPEAEASVQETVTLTPIELNAIEEEERLKAEEVSVEEIVAREEFESDIWDDADRSLWVAKKRYMDYCDALVVPPLKITKDDTPTSKKASVKTESSGYRYELTERAPIFADGIGAGKNTDSYFKREMEYCEKREAERGAHFRDKLRVSWIKTVFSLVIMLTVALIENIGVFFAEGKPDKLISVSNPLLFAIVELVLLGVGACLIFDAIKDGIRLSIKGVFVPETVTCGVVISTLIYHLVLAFAGGSSPYAMLFGTNAAIAMFLTALYRYNMLRREYIAFTVTSSFGEYVTEVKMQGFRSSPEGKAFDGYADPESSLYKLNRVGRIDASYTDKPVCDECYGIIRKLALCIICAAVVAGVVFGIIKRDVFYGALSALSLISFAAPVSVYVALFLPRLRAAAVSAEMGGAVVDFDDESDEYDQNVIMLDDGDLFPAKNIPTPIFEMRHTAGLEESLSRTSALLKKIGGPLKALTMEGGYHDADNVILTDVSEHGVTARIDGRDICAGSDVYMQSMGIKIKRYDKLLPKNSRVMYIADNGVFFAKAIITFVPDQELVRKISELRNTETVFSLKTCNPCIDRELIFYTTGLEPELVRLIKYAPGDDVAPAVTDREGNLVSSNGTIGFITALLEYKRQKKLVFEASRFACVACGIGAFVSLLLSAVGLGFGFTSLVSLAVHGALSAAAFLIASRNAINTKSKIKKQ